jgi:hypothetical protein
VITGLTDEKLRARLVLGARAFLETYCSAEARRSAYLALASHLA